MLVPTFGICKLETQEDFLKWFFFNVDSNEPLTDGEIQDDFPAFSENTENNQTLDTESNTDGTDGTDGKIQAIIPVFNETVTDGTGEVPSFNISFSEQLKRAFDREICQKSHTLKKEVDGITETGYKNTETAKDNFDVLPSFLPERKFEK